MFQIQTSSRIQIAAEMDEARSTMIPSVAAALPTQGPEMLERARAMH